MRYFPDTIFHFTVMETIDPYYVLHLHFFQARILHATGL